MAGGGDQTAGISAIQVCVRAAVGLACLCLAMREVHGPAQDASTPAPSSRSGRRGPRLTIHRGRGLRRDRCAPASFKTCVTGNACIRFQDDPGCRPTLSVLLVRGLPGDDGTSAAEGLSGLPAKRACESPCFGGGPSSVSWNVFFTPCQNLLVSNSFIRATTAPAQWSWL